MIDAMKVNLSQVGPLTEEQLEARRAWVEALESGAYLQGTGFLRSASGFCCLGVFCDVEQVPSIQDFTHPKAVFNYDFDSHMPTGAAAPPHKWLMDKTGFTDFTDFSILNDICGFTFSQIATEIRKATPGL